LARAQGDATGAQLTFAERWQDPAAREALSSEELRGAVFFAGPDDGKPEEDQAVAAVMEALAPLAELRAPARLWWVTRGRWAVEEVSRAASGGAGSIDPLPGGALVEKTARPVVPASQASPGDTRLVAPPGGAPAGEIARPVAPAAQAASRGTGLVVPLPGVALVEEKTRPVVPASHAALWGMGLSVSMEHGARWGGLVDLPPAGAPVEEIARPFIRLLARGSEERQVALRGGATYAARLARLPLPAAELPAFSPGAAYLVTGGLGGLGLKVAGWMADRGARHLVLMTRTGVPERRRWRELPPESSVAAAAAAIQALEARGVHVTVEAMDLSDGPGLARWLETYRAEERPPLRGVVHAAGVLEPAPVLEVSPDRLRRHLCPKLGGALVLEQVLADQPLDFFVLFSSASALVASPQIGEYAAANACLDAIAERRRAAGKPALSIAWGPWGEAGMVLGALRQAGRLFQVMSPMRSADALEVMGKLWRGPPCAAVLPIDWERWRTSYRILLDDPFFAAFAGPPTAAPAPEAKPAAPAKVEEIVPVLAENLKELLARTDEIDPDESLLVMGLDSLMAYDAQHFIQQRWGVEVPVLHFMRGATLSEIAKLVRDATGK
ncbi:MAG TPA: beta-ketoacyl reductase, partial [Myxococcales bacterium]|nr:beta-ketoacyl reductase [Myxococcales bacterium]